MDAPEVCLPPNSKCVHCGEAITLAREVSIARRTWELLQPLRPDADTINVERHLPTQFQLGLPKVETSGGFRQVYGSDRTYNPEVFALSSAGKPGLVSSTFGDPATASHPGPVSAQSPRPQPRPSIPLRSEPSHPDVPVDQKKETAPDKTEPTFAPLDSRFLTDPPPFLRDPSVFRRQTGAEEALSTHTQKTVPMATSPEKGKSKWRLKFTTSKKAPMGTSGDSSSLSSTALEAQKLEEISLSALLSTQKAHARGKLSKNINVHLSQNSTLALFWTQHLIHVWDAGTSPPTMMRAILSESTCILATVARTRLAYIIGTRDQKLTVRLHYYPNPSRYGAWRNAAPPIPGQTDPFPLSCES